MDTSVIVALVLSIYGAVLSTIIAVFDVYKFRRSSKARVHISAAGPMISTDHHLLGEYLSIKVSNVGEKPTTIDGITYRYYASKPWILSRAKSEERGFFNLINRNGELPKRLDVGESWSTIFPYPPRFKEFPPNGYLVIEAEEAGVTNSFRYARTRLKLRK